MAERSYLHALRREVVEVAYTDPGDPWFTEHQPEAQGFEAPAYHVTRARHGPASRVEPGDTIWLFSQLHAPWGRFPPSLDARIVVASVGPRSDPETGAALPGFRYRAGPGSRWFPLHDATGCLRSLRTRNAAGDVRPVLHAPDQTVGRALRGMRQADDDAPLRALEARLDEAGYEFVSYRLVDGTEAAFGIARSRVAAGAAVFWDRWSLPRRLAERREFLSEHALDELIRARIADAQVVWGIETPAYGRRGSYSEWESREAAATGNYRAVAAASAATFDRPPPFS